MNALSRYVLSLLLLSCALSTSVWAAEPSPIQLPPKPSISIEAAQQIHPLDTADYAGILSDLNTLSFNDWGAYQGEPIAPQCVLRVQISGSSSFTPIALSFFNDNQGMVYIENPTNGALGGVATGIPLQSIPNIVRICQAYWQPVINP